MARKGAGRKRIPMKKIENPSNLEVTFSKRRSGVYKKASELCLLCDCHVAIVIFSAANKIYSFGDPSAEKILNSFINGIPQQESVVQHLIKSYDFCQLIEEMIEYEAIVEAEKKRENASNEVQNDPHDENSFHKWWLTPVQELTLAEAEDMLAKVEEVEHSIDISGKQAQTSSSRHTNVESLGVRCGDDLRLTPDPYLASTSQGFENKGKAPTWDLIAIVSCRVICA